MSHAQILNKQPLRVCTMNVNSIKSSSKMALAIDTLLRIDPHIMIMTESRIDDTYNPRFPNYQVVSRIDRDANGGGILCIAKNGIKVHNVKEYSLTKRVQVTVFRVKSVQIIGVYKSPRTNAQTERSLIAKLSELMAAHADSVVLGDFNLPNIPTNWPRDQMPNSLGSIEREWLSMAALSDLTQLVHQPTYRKSNNTLDLVLAAPRLSIHGCWVVPDVDPTFDHCPVVVELGHAPVLKETRTLKYKETEESWQQFKFFMKDIPTKEVLETQPTTKEDLEAACVSLVTSMRGYYEASTPSYWRKVNERNPWITNELRKEMNSVRTLNRNAKKERDRTKRESMYVKLKLRRKTLQQNIHNAQRNHQKLIVKQCSKNSKEFFRLMDGFKPPAAPVGPIEIDGTLTTDENRMANEFNKYLTSFFGKKRSLMSGWQTYTDSWRLPTAADFIAKIRNLRNGSAPGDDGITVGMVKRSMGTLAPILAAITKCVVDLGYFPEVFKSTKVKMLYKKGSRQDMNNYRPIALLSIIGKLIESVLADELVRQLEKDGILDASQHGFRAKNGCHTALISMWKGVTDKIDLTGGCTMVGLDLKKAFDLADHQILLDELAASKVEYRLGEVIKSWLTDRKQHVQVGNTRSIDLPVNASVVQGSRLGPLLWLTYINGLLKRLREKNHAFTAYADDVVLYTSINGPSGEKNLIEALKIIEDWSNDHKMVFSSSKSNYMQIGRQMAIRPKLNGNPIPQTKRMVVLGVTFTDSGKFTQMAKELAAKAHFKIRVLRNNLKYRDMVSMKLIYNAYIRSRLFYCSQVWLQKDAVAEKTIRGACKAFWNLGKYGRPPEVLTTREQLYYNDISLVKHLQSGHTVVRGLNLQISGNDVRSDVAGKFAHQAGTRFVARNEFSRRVVSQWNWLPSSARTSQDSPSFPRKLRAIIADARNAVDTCGQLPRLP